jgi:hypothetical protein
MLRVTLCLVAIVDRVPDVMLAERNRIRQIPLAKSEGGVDVEPH